MQRFCIDWFRSCTRHLYGQLFSIRLTIKVCKNSTFENEFSTEYFKFWSSKIVNYLNDMDMIRHEIVCEKEVCTLSFFLIISRSRTKESFQIRSFDKSTHNCIAVKHLYHWPTHSMSTKIVGLIIVLDLRYAPNI